MSMKAVSRIVPEGAMPKDMTRMAPNYQGVLDYCRPILDNLILAGKTKCFDFIVRWDEQEEEPKGRWEFKPERMNDVPQHEYNRFVNWCAAVLKDADQRQPTGRLGQHINNTHATLQEISLLGNFFGDGVHLLECDERTAQAMSHMDLPIKGPEYHQPFRSMGVQLHDMFIIVDWNREANRLATGVVSHDYSDVFYMLLHHDETFDEGFDRVYALPREKEGVVPDRRNVMRTAMNLCLFATHNGTTQDTSNVNYRKRTEDRLAKSIKRGDQKLTDVNRRELATIPFRLTINQTTPLYRETKSTDKDCEHTGRTMAPHWRRGHWRRQHYGKGNAQTKLIPIPAVLVNADLFLGDRSNTFTRIKE